MIVEQLRTAEANYRRGRSGSAIDCIVIHCIDGRTGSLESAAHWFADPVAEASAHYGVGRDGRLVQWVDESDTAFHAGKKVRPTAALVLERADVNPNLFSIGVECEGRASDGLTPTQLEALAELVADIATRHAIPLNRRHVLGHREIRADKSCPGRIDVDQVVGYAQVIVARAEATAAFEAEDVPLGAEAFVEYTTPPRRSLWRRIVDALLGWLR